MTIISLILALFVIEASCQSCQDPEPGLLSDLVRRGRNYTLSNGESPVNDLLIKAGWFTTIVGTVQYRMTDSSNKPSLQGCGTVGQIYLQGQHPTGITATPVNVTACVQNYFNNCSSTTTVQIRNCDGRLQYFLVATGHLQAYCFDPDIAVPPKSFYPGPVTIVPDLTWTAETRSEGVFNVPALFFKCMFNETLGLFYTVSWFVNGHLKFTKGPTVDTDSLQLHQSELQQEHYTFGIDLQCSVMASQDSTGTPTSATSSAEFYVGIRIIKSNIVLPNENAVQFRSTVPIGCFHKQGETTCISKLHVEMSNPNFTCSGNFPMTFQRCSTEMKLLVTNEQWISSEIFDFKLTSKFTTVEKTTYNLFLQTSAINFPDHFFDSYRLPIISVTVNTLPTFYPKHCYSHVDPHMKTFDMRQSYENQKSGDYVLYRNTMHGIEVQERTMPCNTKAKCSCQVAVRAGGDVFIINRCLGSTKFNEFVLCNDDGTLDVVQENAYTYKIYTSIGTIIRIADVYKGFLNVDIYSSPNDVNNVVGLCGFYDGNSTNDFKKRDGSQAANRNTDYKFSEDWRVTANEGLLTGYNLDHVTNWNYSNIPLCVCQQSEPFLYASSPKIVNEAACEPHLFQGCFRINSITGNKCSKRQTRKRRDIDKYSFYKSHFVPEHLADYTLERQKRAATNNKVSEDIATAHCSDIIRASPAVTMFPDRLMGADIDDVINQCAFDVVASDGDFSFAEIHAASLAEVVKQTLQYEPTYEAMNHDAINKFLQQTCPNNCSGKGVCSTEGTCDCENGYHGPDCSVLEGDPIDISSPLDDIICSESRNGECKRCIWFHTEKLIKNFYCKFIHVKSNRNGTKERVGEFVVPGHFDDLYSGKCCLPKLKAKRSVLSPDLGEEWELFISNDGIVYGSGTRLYVIEQTCAAVTTDPMTNERILAVKEGFCFIENNCVEDSAKKPTDLCQACRASDNKYSWTDVCADKFPVTWIVAICVGGGVLLLVGGIIVFGICRFSKRKRITA